MLGHELRNPLSPIVMAVELMQQRGVKLEGAVDHRAPAQAAHAAGRRPPRRLEDHAREGRPPQGAHVDRRGRQARRRDHAAAVSSRGSSRSTLDVPGDLFVDGDPTRLAAGVREPADERLEVQRSGHGRPRLGEARREIASRSAFATTGSASARRCSSACSICSCSSRSRWTAPPAGSVSASRSSRTSWPRTAARFASRAPARARAASSS